MRLRGSASAWLPHRGGRSPRSRTGCSTARERVGPVDVPRSHGRARSRTQAAFIRGRGREEVDAHRARRAARAARRPQPLANRRRAEAFRAHHPNAHPERPGEVGDPRHGRAATRTTDGRSGRRDCGVRLVLFYYAERGRQPFAHRNGRAAPRTRPWDHRRQRAKAAKLPPPEGGSGDQILRLTAKKDRQCRNVWHLSSNRSRTQWSLRSSSG